MENNSRAIITSASNKFFPSLLNFIGSIKANYPNHPHIYIYNLGLFQTYQVQLRSIPNVSLIDMPPFTTFWRKCYTWKTYIFKNPFTDTILYLDAGNEVLRPLDTLFEQIEQTGYLAVEQTVASRGIIPKDYISLFKIPESTFNKNAIAAGLFGFSRNNALIQQVIDELHDASLAGLCLGYSKGELWKNKGVNKNFFVRDCPQFRHDTTLLTILLYKLIPDLKVDSISRFSNEKNSEQLIWNLRMNYDTLKYVKDAHACSASKTAVLVNKIILPVFFLLKRINKAIKSIIK